MGKTLYLECNSGISGDMTVAALLDLGADWDVLKAVLDSIPAHGFSVEKSRVKKAGIDCMDFHVILDREHENHDHDMEYLHGHDHGHSHDHAQSHDHAHDHGHDHAHSHDDGHGHAHTHRGLAEITDILDRTAMTEGARTLAKKIFRILAESEARAHAVPLDQVHFHEVGAIDSIVDIVAVAVCVDNLGIDQVIVSKLCEGCGTVRCQHGILPVPVPAVANILEAYGLPVEFTSVQGELVTPTGAAIVAALMTGSRMPDRFRLVKTGLGAGKRQYERPSILRAMMVEENGGERDVVWKLESDIDDCTGETLGYVMERLFAAGARDVHYTPVFMKKNRPAWQLNVICTEADLETMEHIIFLETTTIGIRRMKVERSVLKREIRKAATEFGQVDVKVCRVGEQEKFYPEYESVAAISREKGLPYRTVYQAAVNGAVKQ